MRDGVFDHFPDISEDSPKHTSVDENFPKFSEDCPDELTRQTNLRPQRTIYETNSYISEIVDIFTSEDMENMPLESRMYLV